MSSQKSPSNESQTNAANAANAANDAQDLITNISASVSANDEVENVEEVLEYFPENDISRHDDIFERYQTSLFRKWIKTIPIEKTILFEEYTQREYFTHVANIVSDNELNALGVKKRNTVIQFIPTIPSKKFSQKTEWLYLIVINGRIVKIGGTRTGLKGRVSSYLCGHHIPERKKSGDCSKTNGYIYNTLDFYLELGCHIEMYGYELPRIEFTVSILEKDVNVVAQTYHAYESTFLEDYKDTYGDYPVLSDNADPDYK
jgi:dimeric dUTPase (all-alpha-NTP-PPase superfamily)